MPQIQGVKGEAVVSYCEPLIRLRRAPAGQATQIEDPAPAGRWGIIGFPAG